MLSLLCHSALLTQTGTSAPTAIILQNDIGEITWERLGVGLYRANGTGLFPDGRTTQYAGGRTLPPAINSAVPGTEDGVIVATYNNNTVDLSDGMLTKTEITIKVYRENLAA